MATKKKKAAGPEKAVVARREPTQREIDQREAHKARNLQRPDRPESTMKVVGAMRVVSASGHQDEKLYHAALMEAFGTRSLPFVNDTLDNITRALAKGGRVTDQQQNAAVAILAAVEPENELEATLAAQMVAANDAAMRCLRQMAGAEWVPQQQMYGGLAAKFMRTFGAHVETLAKLRRKGEQIVKHVHVHEGGQAVVAGTINHGGGVHGKVDGQLYGTGVLEECAALPGPDEARDGLPLAGDAERPLSHTRRS